MTTIHALDQNGKCIGTINPKYIISIEGHPHEEGWLSITCRDQIKFRAYDLKEPTYGKDTLETVIKEIKRNTKYVDVRTNK